MWLKPKADLLFAIRWLKPTAMEDEANVIYGSCEHFMKGILPSVLTDGFCEAKILGFSHIFSRI